MPTHTIENHPKHLWFLMVSYTMILVFCNWFAARLVHIGGLDIDSANFLFPITYLLADMITEVYGYKQARRAIWCGFLFNVILIAYGQIITQLPSPPYPNHNEAFDTILTANMRIVLASAISYLIAEPLNSYIMAKLKILSNGKYLASRFLLSTIAAAGVDSFIFSTLAFYGVIPGIKLLYFIITMWLVKVLIELFILPISTKLTRKLKQIEQLDIYDKRTAFNIFSLNAQYQDSDNEFKR